MEKGEEQRLTEAHRRLSTHRKKSFNKIASGGQCVVSPLCMSHLPVLDARAGTERCSAQGRRCCEMKAGVRMEGGGFTDMGDSEGHLGAQYSRFTGKRQKWKDWFMERNEQEMAFVRKVALLTEQLLPLSCFK